MPLFLRFFHSVRPAMMPARIACNSPNRRCASEGGAHGEGLNNTILTNVRRIDPVSFVATQLGAHEVSNLGGIDDADNMTGLVQRTRDAETIAPSGFQTGVNSLDLSGSQPIQEMVPSIR